ncbi:copper transporter [Sanguibacter sp. A247]|uniref:copper transporter n=1 Tax=unclassified Sanguibacter TaxID=2645534 RepID=UPI003FD83182
MIDFRYHLVSLISVFLALAVGIVLGAGPLKEAIGDQLTGQVETLRADKEKLRDQLSTAESDLVTRDAFLAATAPQLTAGTITGRRVAFIELADVDDATVDALSTHLVAAGAQIAGTVQVSEQWTSESQARYRQALVPSLTDYLPNRSTGGSHDADLARALVLSLVQLAPEGDVFSPDALQLQRLLAAGDFVTYSEGVQPADMIVVLAPGTVDPDVTPTSPSSQDATTLLIQQELPRAAAELAEGSLVAGAGDAPLVRAIIEGDDADLVTTVDDMSAITGQISVPLALAARAAGTVGHFGTGPGATAVAPAVVRLAEIDRTARRAAAPEVPADDEADGSEDGAVGGAEADADADADADAGADAEAGDE